MIKPEWGTKQNCPKCGTRFYDLGKDDPATCIECGNEWDPEPVLKSKQPMPFDEADKKTKEGDSDLADDEDVSSDIDEEEDSPDNDIDLGGDDDLGVTKSKGDDDDKDET
ncbi:TIGR02300 family protein [Sphingorhabdus sp. Alg239-R122]|uniref:TIGR02300 family protein n=1 Tax=Sphingorhabdus sp. Alg239-R122 TaxID=2305989 RepID=UPI0013DD0A7B|nr:TIGR02300 family protein [Sphingorhabdus sp. Alg239-R122]